MSDGLEFTQRLFDLTSPSLAAPFRPKKITLQCCHQITNLQNYANGLEHRCIPLTPWELFLLTAEP